MKIDALLKAARESGFVAFANLVCFARTGNSKWTITILKDHASAAGVSPHGAGETPEDAFQAAADRVGKWIESARDRSARELNEQNELLAALNAKEGT